MPPIFFWSEDEKEAFQLMIDTLAKDINSLFDLIATLREGAAIPSESLPSRYQPFYKRVQCHKKRVLSGDYPPFSSQKMLLFFAPNWILFTFWKGGSAMNKRMVGSPKENINMLSLSLTILSIWDTDVTYYNLWLFLFRDISVAFFGLDWNNSFKLLDKFAKCMDEMRSEPTSSLWTLVLPQHLLHDLLQLESDLEAHQEAVLKGRTNREEKEHIR